MSQIAKLKSEVLVKILHDSELIAFIIGHQGTIDCVQCLGDRFLYWFCLNSTTPKIKQGTLDAIIIVNAKVNVSDIA